jgi:hypothetical protein
MRALAAKWNTFWFEASFLAWQLAAVRIIFTWILQNHLLDTEIAAPPFGDWKYPYLTERFYSPFFDFIPLPSYPVFVGLSRLLYFFCLMAMIGLWTRFSMLISSGILFYLFMLNKIAYLNYFYSMVIVLFLLAFTPCGEKFSVDALISRRARQRVVFSWAARLLQVTVSVIYLATATSKTIPSWMSGEIMGALIEFRHVRIPEWMSWARIFLPVTLAWGTLLIEYYLAFALWFSATRFWALIAGALFHLILDATMSIGSFSWQMMALYIFFLPAPKAAVKIKLANDGR